MRFVTRFCGIPPYVFWKKQDLKQDFSKPEVGYFKTSFQLNWVPVVVGNLGWLVEGQAGPCMGCGVVHGGDDVLVGLYPQP